MGIVEPVSFNATCVNGPVEIGHVFDGTESMYGFRYSVAYGDDKYKMSDLYEKAMLSISELLPDYPAPMFRWFSGVDKCFPVFSKYAYANVHVDMCKKVYSFDLRNEPTDDWEKIDENVKAYNGASYRCGGDELEDHFGWFRELWGKHNVADLDPEIRRIAVMITDSVPHGIVVKDLYPDVPEYDAPFARNTGGDYHKALRYWDMSAIRQGALDEAVDPVDWEASDEVPFPPSHYLVDMSEVLSYFEGCMDPKPTDDPGAEVERTFAQDIQWVWQKLRECMKDEGNFEQDIGARLANERIWPYKNCDVFDEKYKGVLASAVSRCGEVDYGSRGGFWMGHKPERSEDVNEYDPLSEGSYHFGPFTGYDDDDNHGRGEIQFMEYMSLQEFSADLKDKNVFPVVIVVQDPERLPSVDSAFTYETLFGFEASSEVWSEDDTFRAVSTIWEDVLMLTAGAGNFSVKATQSINLETIEGLINEAVREAIIEECVTTTRPPHYISTSTTKATLQEGEDAQSQFVMLAASVSAVSVLAVSVYGCLTTGAFCGAAKLGRTQTGEISMAAACEKGSLCEKEEGCST